MKHDFILTKNPGYSFSKAKNINFYATYKERKAFVPGVGKYKDLDRGIEVLSRPASKKSVLKTRQ